MIPKITEVKSWYSADVRNMCAARQWYTAGDVQAYNKMLSIVETTSPTNDAIYIVAKDIMEHSSDESLTVESIMYEIANSVVRRRFILG